MHATVTAGCGHEVNIEIDEATLCIVCCPSATSYDELCEGCLSELDEKLDEDECGDCYRRNHPSLTAYERNA